MACGKRGPQAGLVRFRVSTEGDGSRVVRDSSGPRLGRGAYLCPRRACLEQAIRRRAFNRAFRRTVRVDVDELVAEIEGRLDEENGRMAGEE